MASGGFAYLATVVGVFSLNTCSASSSPETTRSDAGTSTDAVQATTLTTSLSAGSPEAAPLCQLPILLRDSTAGVRGIPTELTGPEPGESDFVGPDRDHWRLRILVDGTVPNSASTATRAAGNPLPSLDPGATVDIFLYDDWPGASVDSLGAAIEGAQQILVLLNGSGDPDSPARPGFWFAGRVAMFVDNNVTFPGMCADDLAAEFDAVAAAMGRPADIDFLVDFEAEVLGRGESGQLGPIESAAFELYDR